MGRRDTPGELPETKERKEMKRLSHEEVMDMFQQTLGYKRAPDSLRNILLTSVMDLYDEIHEELERRNEQMQES